MKSPFPGMDPYLEQHWGDVHQRLAVYACNALQPCLPNDLRARTEERVYVEREEGARCIVPDIAITDTAEPWRPGGRPQGGGSVVAEPVQEVRGREVREAFIEIRVKGGGALVTVIEFLSPGNKLPGNGRDVYKQKQLDLEHADVHLVEIDLVRAGPRAFHFPRPVSSRHECDCMACVRVGSRFSLYAFPLDCALPSLRIPLRYDEEPVLLNLQELHDQAYRDGRYDDTNYALPPEPPLPLEVEAWADALLRSAGVR